METRNIIANNSIMKNIMIMTACMSPGSLNVAKNSERNKAMTIAAKIPPNIKKNQTIHHNATRAEIPFLLKIIR